MIEATYTPAEFAAFKKALKHLDSSVPEARIDGALKLNRIEVSLGRSVVSEMRARIAAELVGTAVGE